MGTPQLNLVVLRSPNIDRAVQFYQLLGLSFTKHAHGKGPEHYSAELSGCVFELYPSSPLYPPTTATRIGFMVDAIDELWPQLETLGATIVRQPHNSPWGRRIVLQDLDGHTVELTDFAENL